MATIFNNTKSTSTATAKFSKELKVSTTIIGNDGNPVVVNLGYIALFNNNDVLSAIADMNEQEVNNLASKLILSVQEAGIRQEKAKRTITFA